MRRILLVTTVTFAIAAMVATGAVAGSSARYRTDGRSVSTYWTQVDGPPAAGQPFGNVHVGWLDGWESSTGKADVFVYIDDFSCPTGVLPDWGGHGADDGKGCEYVASRTGEGYGLALTMDRKLTRATVKGRITMTSGGAHGEGGQVVGTPKADITWHGSGPSYKSVSTYRGSGGGTTYRDRYRATERNATMSGSLGPMGFAPELSGGSISAYRSMYAESQR